MHHTTKLQNFNFKLQKKINSIVMLVNDLRQLIQTAKMHESESMQLVLVTSIFFNFFSEFGAKLAFFALEVYEKV